GHPSAAVPRASVVRRHQPRHRASGRPHPSVIDYRLLPSATSAARNALDVSVGGSAAASTLSTLCSACFAVKPSPASASTTSSRTTGDCAVCCSTGASPAPWVIL